MKLQSCLPRCTAFLTAFAGAACISLLGGCGQKGPLYMPQGQQGYGMPRVTPPATPASVAAPATLPATTVPLIEVETTSPSSLPDSK